MKSVDSWTKEYEPLLSCFYGIHDSQVVNELRDLFSEETGSHISRKVKHEI